MTQAPILESPIQECDDKTEETGDTGSEAVWSFILLIRRPWLQRGREGFNLEGTQNEVGRPRSPGFLPFLQR